MDVGVFPGGEHVEVGLEGVVDFDLGAGTIGGEAAVVALGVEDGYEEGVTEDELAFYFLAGGEGDGDGDIGVVGGLAGLTHGHARDDGVLEGLGLVTAADAGEVAGGGVAFGAFAGAVEVCFAGVGVADEDVDGGGFGVVAGGHVLAVDEGGDVADVGSAQGKRGHAFGDAAVLDDGGHELSVLVVEDELGADEVGAGLAAAGVGAVAEGAVDAKELFAVGDFGRVAGGAFGVVLAANAGGWSGGFGWRRRRSWSLRNEQGAAQS